jgi:hypothetical protein
MFFSVGRAWLCAWHVKQRSMRIVVKKPPPARQQRRDGGALS